MNCRNLAWQYKQLTLKLKQEVPSPHFLKQFEDKWQFMLMTNLFQKWSFAGGRYFNSLEQSPSKTILVSFHGVSTLSLLTAKSRVFHKVVKVYWVNNVHFAIVLTTYSLDK